MSHHLLLDNSVPRVLFKPEYTEFPVRMSLRLRYSPWELAGCQTLAYTTHFYTQVFEVTLPLLFSEYLSLPSLPVHFLLIVKD